MRFKHSTLGCNGTGSLRLLELAKTGRRCCKLPAAADEERVGTDEEGIRALARKVGKGRLDLAARAGIEEMKFQPERAGGFLHPSQRGLGDGRVGRIDEDFNTS